MLAAVLDDLDPAHLGHHDSELVQQLRVAPGHDENGVPVVAAGPMDGRSPGRATRLDRLRRRLAERVHGLATDPAGDPQPRMDTALARL
jgi:hypothetical protein